MQADIQSPIATVLLSHTAASVEGFAVGWHAGGELQVHCDRHHRDVSLLKHVLKL